MTPGEARDAIHDVLTAKGFERAPARDAGTLRYDGEVLAGGRAVAVAVLFPCLDFTVFPRVLLLDREAQLPGVAAHIEGDDGVCYAAPGSIVLDRYDPAGASLLVLQQAAAALEAGISGASAPDVRAEFAQHWGEVVFLTALGADAADGPARLVAVPRGGKPQAQVLTRDGIGLELFPAVPARPRDQRAAPAFLLRLRGELDLPHGRRPPRTLGQLLRWAGELEDGLAERVLGCVGHRAFLKRNPLMFFVAANGCVGVEVVLPPQFRAAVQRPQFQADQVLRHAGSVAIRRWGGQRIDRAFMLARNLGGRPSLAGRRVVLVGCGTIGSHLARFLVQNGAGGGRPGCLWLVDDDVLSAGNVGRHLLGPRHIHRPKAEALAEELVRQFPGSEIRAVAGSAMGVLRTLAAADLVVDATGEEALSLALNTRMVDLRPAAPDALYVWLAGGGAAAQALLVPSRGDGACLKCLRPVLSEPPRFDPVAPGAAIPAVPAACGEGAYQPFGVEASAIAAGLASRMCMEWTGGHVPLTLRTLRVNPASTLEVPDCSPARVPGCPCCGRPGQAASLEDVA